MHTNTNTEYIHLNIYMFYSKYAYRYHTHTYLMIYFLSIGYIQYVLLQVIIFSFSYTSILPFTNNDILDDIKKKQILLFRHLISYLILFHLYSNIISYLIKTTILK